MDEHPIMKADHIGHLGLITSIFEDYGLTSKIDWLLPKRFNGSKAVAIPGLKPGRK